MNTTLTAQAQDAQDVYEQGLQRLAGAVRAGQVEEVRALLGSTVILNAVLVDGKTALHLAVEARQDDVLKLLLQQPGIDLNATDQEGAAPLHLAARMNQMLACNLLLDHGADDQQPGPEGRTPLHEACRAGHESVVTWLMAQDSFRPDGPDKGAALNALDQHGMTPLRHAVQEGRHGVVERLLEAEHLDPNLADNDHCSPLHIAARAGEPRMIECLLGHGDIQIDAEDAQGTPPLVYALLAGQWNAAQSLLDKGADVLHADQQGNTALARLCLKGNLAAVTWLLDTPQFQAIDLHDVLNARNRSGQSPLQLAAFAPSPAVVDLLLHRSEVDLTPVDAQGRTALHDAARRASPAVAALLLVRTDVDINATDVSGSTPLLLAIQAKQPAMARWLAENTRADLGKANRAGVTPLHAACELGDRTTVQWLLPALAKQTGEPLPSALGQANALGQSPLLLACRSGHADLVRDLLRHSTAQINEPDHEGTKPLQEAITRGHADVVRQLLKSSALRLSASPSEDTPLYFAMSVGNVDIARALRARGVDIRVSSHTASPLFVACQNGHLAAVQWMLAEVARLPSTADQKAVLNAASTYGASALHVAIEVGHAEIAKKLLEQPLVDPQHTDWLGWTPLHQAAGSGRLTMLDLLAGTAVDAQAVDGSTPYHLAIVYGHLDVAQRLIDLGADIQKTRKDGCTDLHLASNEGHLEGVEWLLQRHSTPGKTVPPAVLNAVHQHGATPLALAARNGKPTVVQCLLNQPGLAAHTPNHEGWTPLHLAARAGSDGAVALLLQRPGVHAGDDGPHRMTFLHSACCGDNALAVVQAIRATMSKAAFQALVDRVDELGRTAQSIAIERGLGDDLIAALRPTDTAQPIMARPVTAPRGWVVTGPGFPGKISTSLLQKGQNGGIPMHAVGDGTQGLAWRDLEAMDIQYGDFVVCTFHGTLDGELQTVTVRLSDGSLVPLVDLMLLMYKKGATKLVVTACNARNAAEAFFRRLQRDPTVPKPGRPTLQGFPSFSFTIIGREGTTLIELNAAIANEWVGDRILDPKPTRSLVASPPPPAPARSVQPMVTFSWPARGKAWQQTSQPALTLQELSAMKGTAAQRAKEELMFMHCFDGNLEAVRQLLEVHHVSANISLATGAMPLHLAADSGHKEVVRLLCQHGANIDQPDARAYVPIHYAIERGHLDTCNLLLRLGANPNPQNAKTMSALAFAVHHEQIAIARVLLQAGAARDLTFSDGTTLLQLVLNKGNPALTALFQ
ncbi:ankyrin repeat domain-containing protein [Hydrogenophaga sp. BPS33]|uniref:ankyrin repeat domain-containing protein n=1 Tax=Hydrogenophaga sp. BPS33 TaxID=2651974 RepID=UPI00135BAEF1|nr:ankyrin repeat domain-containing protein [Hydrogenophaga sp. BPS33]